MDATMYLSHYETEDSEVGMIRPRVEFDRDADDETIYIRFKAGHKYATNQILITMTPAQFQQFAADCARVAAEKNQEVPK